MDESLSDFRETKRSCTGPKKVIKTNKPKKAKRIRGQKDIRTVLKTKKSDLESYTEDFDSVCKKAGIDVDPESLQLAIALSKSLQEPASITNEAAHSKQVVNTQDRLGKIRTTLQEYGFKVPEVKIAKQPRKVNKHRKNYKLILTSDTERKEIIANRYSQILFQDITHCSLYSCEVDTADIPLYYLASNAAYGILKIIDTFYVPSLMEKSTGTGNLLKDWSNIPGRPVSPQVFESSDMNFSEIECSQDELDIVLSGSLKKCKEVIKTKQPHCSKTILLQESPKPCFVKEIDQNVHDKTLEKDINLISNMPVSKEIRSCSPDIFDEDASSILEQSRNSTVKESDVTVELHHSNVDTIDLTACATNNTANQKHFIDKNLQKKWITNSDITKRKSNDFMELTECIQYPSKNYDIVGNQGSQNSLKLLDESLKSNSTKRISNDFMEITECVATLSQPHPKDTIDLTQTKYVVDKNKIIEVIEPDQNEGKLLKKSNIIQDIGDADESIEHMDLTQSSNTSDELPLVSLTALKDDSLDATIIVNVNEYANMIQKKMTFQDPPGIHIDLTQYSERVHDFSHSQSFFDEYIHDHSRSTEEAKEKNSSESEKSNSDKIDLSQIENNVACNKGNCKEIIEENSIASAHKYNKYADIEVIESVKTRSGEKYSQNNCLNVPEKPHCSDNDSCYSNNKQSKSSKVTPTLSANENCKDDSNIDLTQSSEEMNDCTSKHDSANSNKLTLPENSNVKSDLDIRSQNSDIFEEINVTPSHESGTSNKLCIIEDDHDETDIDLTQNSSTSEDINDRQTEHESNKSINITGIINCDKSFSTEEKDLHALSPIRKSGRYSSAGKKDDISIDYDDIIVNNVDYETPDSKNADSRSNSYIIVDDNVEKHSKNSFASNCSQNSEVFEIFDKELDYSIQKSKLETPRDNFVFGGISVMDELSNLGSSKNSLNVDVNLVENNEYDVEILPAVVMNANKSTRGKEISPIKHRRITEIATPQKSSPSSIITVTTPQNSELIIKTNNVTPLLDYNSMSLEDIHKELDKYGIKPFKRKRAIKLLTHIYNQTHPVIEAYDDEDDSPSKRHKPNEDQSITLPSKQLSPRKLLQSPRKHSEVNIGKQDNVIMVPSETYQAKEVIMDRNVPESNKEYGNKKKNNKANCRNTSENVTERIDVNDHVQIIPSGSKEVASTKSTRIITEVPVTKEIECKPEDWVFQKREKAKVHSCRVPLHIAFYNYVASRRDLREAILCYEPVEIDVIHKDLVGYGHRYDPKDLLKFLDKKCITVKTTDNDARNQKR